MEKVGTPANQAIVFDEGPKKICVGPVSSDGKVPDKLDEVLECTDIYAVAGLLAMGFDPKNDTDWDNIFAKHIFAPSSAPKTDAKAAFRYLLRYCGRAYIKTNRHLKQFSAPIAIDVNVGGRPAGTRLADDKVVPLENNMMLLGYSIEWRILTLGDPSGISAGQNFEVLYRHPTLSNCTDLCFSRLYDTADGKLAPVDMWNFRQQGETVTTSGTLTGSKCRMSRQNFCKFVVALGGDSLNEEVFKGLTVNNDPAVKTRYPGINNTPSFNTVMLSRYLTLNRIPILDAAASGKETIAKCDKETRQAAAKAIFTKLRDWFLWDASVTFPNETVGQVPQDSTIIKPEYKRKDINTFK